MTTPDNFTTTAATSARYRAELPQLHGRPMAADGGLETDLIFHHDVDLPSFASFPLLDDERGRELLDAYFQDYVDIARRHGVGAVLETPTWRANAEWGATVDYGAVELDRVNRAAVDQLVAVRERNPDVEPIVISGCIGPRGDGYLADTHMSPGEAQAYHAPQIASFSDTPADLVSAYTLVEPNEAIGIVRAARIVAMPVAISFTVETDGLLASGTTLAAAIDTVDAETDGGPDYYLVNCAHPTHIAHALGDDDAPWRERVLGVRANASTMSHAELDEAAELDDGDPDDLAAAHAQLRRAFPNLTVAGGCCGTDHRHVEAIWSSWPTRG